MNWLISATTAVLNANSDGTFVGTLDGDTSSRKVGGSYVLNDAGELQLSLAREAALPAESRYLLASDSLGLGIYTSNTGYRGGCLVLER